VRAAACAAVPLHYNPGTSSLTILQRQHSSSASARELKFVLFLTAETQVVDPNLLIIGAVSERGLYQDIYKNYKYFRCTGTDACSALLVRWAQKHWLASPRRLYSIVVFSFDTTGKVSALPSKAQASAAGCN
jgi:hypothetical protein